MPAIRVGILSIYSSSSLLYESGREGPIQNVCAGRISARPGPRKFFASGRGMFLLLYMLHPCATYVQYSICGSIRVLLRTGYAGRSCEHPRRLGVADFWLPWCYMGGRVQGLGFLAPWSQGGRVYNRDCTLLECCF